MALQASPSERDGPDLILEPQPTALDGEMVERAAQTLFEFVFSNCKRLDGKHFWMNCDEDVREGFRAEARTVIQASGRLACAARSEKD